MCNIHVQNVLNLVQLNTEGQKQKKNINIKSTCIKTMYQNNTALLFGLVLRKLTSIDFS